jgi:hypothetical protein
MAKLSLAAMRQRRSAGRLPLRVKLRNTQTKHSPFGFPPDNGHGRDSSDGTAPAHPERP